MLQIRKVYARIEINFWDWAIEVLRKSPAARGLVNRAYTFFYAYPLARIFKTDALAFALVGLALGLLLGYLKGIILS